MAFAASVARSRFCSSWQHWASLPLFESCPRGVDFSTTGVIQHVSLRRSSVVDLSATPSDSCLEPAAEVPRDQLLPPEVSRTAVSLELCCPTREKVSRRRPLAKMSCTWEGAQQIPFSNPAFGRTPFVCLKLARTTISAQAEVNC